MNERKRSWILIKRTSLYVLKNCFYFLCSFPLTLLLLLVAFLGDMRAWMIQMEDAEFLYLYLDCTRSEAGCNMAQVCSMFRSCAEHVNVHHEKPSKS
jgi:hypothetical protein